MERIWAELKRASKDSKKERSVMNIKKGNAVKKMWTMLLTAAASALLLAGCASSKLADAFDEASVKASAQELIDHLTAGEYQEAADMMSKTMQEALPMEQLASAMETVGGPTGAFQKYKSIAVVGQKDDSGADYAVAVVVAAYEKGTVTYNVSFDTNMEVTGLWMK